MFATLLASPLSPLVAAYLLGMVTIFGLLVGSFINVVAWRVPTGQSIVFPGSHCPGCGAPIRAADNVPVVAWLLLRGRCRTCLGSISLRYPIVEALSGGLTAAFAVHDGPVPLLAFHLAYVYGLLALALIDLDTWLLPFSISLPLIPLAILSALVDPSRTVVEALIGAGIGWSMIVIIGKVAELALGKEAMGGGDAWLMASIGAFAGPTLMMVALFLASFQGAVIGGLLLTLFPRQEPLSPSPPPPQTPEASSVEAPKDLAEDEEDWVPDPHAVPFGPFLALGATECLLFAPTIEELLHRVMHLAT